MTTRNYVILFMVTLVVGLYAYSKMSPVTATRNSQQSARSIDARLTTEYATEGWMREEIQRPGSVANLPFISIRKQIDSLKSDPQNLFAALAHYKKQARESPKDAQAQFRWAYSAFLASDYQATPPPRTPKLLDDIYLSLGEAPNPHSFEYTRIHFLVGYLNSVESGSEALKQYGIKFLNLANPDDFDLRYMAISSYANTLGMKHQQPIDKCLNLATALQKDFPERYITWDLLGRLYSDKFFFVKDPQYADKSIHCYQQIIHMAPEQSRQWQVYAKRQISLTKRYKNQLKTTGKL